MDWGGKRELALVGKKSMEKTCQLPSVQAETAECKHVSRTSQVHSELIYQCLTKVDQLFSKSSSLGFCWHANQQNCIS